MKVFAELYNIIKISMYRIKLPVRVGSEIFFEDINL